MVWPFNKKQEKAAPAASPKDAPIQSQIVYVSRGTSQPLVNYSSAISAEDAMSHFVVYRALDKIAASVQQVGWYVDEDPSATASERRSVRSKINDFQSLLENPNNDMTPAMLRYWMALNYAAYGRVPYKVSFSATDDSMPNGIYPLNAAETFAIQNDRGIIERYEYGTLGMRQTIPSKYKAGSGKSFADQIWKPGLKGYQYLNDINTPMASIGLPAHVIKSLLHRAIRTAEGHPNSKYIITGKNGLTDEQREYLDEYINEGHSEGGERSGSAIYLRGDIDLLKLDNDLSDIHSKTPSDDMARIIFGAFGIPIALAGIGAADGAKYAGNYVESRMAFWQDTIVPSYVEPLFQGISRSICPKGLKILPNLESIPAMLDSRISSMSKLQGVDFLTADEKREMFGYNATTKQKPENQNG